MDKDLRAPRYNVRAVVKATGLTPDTLRVWERRYGLPQPQRTPGGHRLYSQHDVEMLKWLIDREREGLSISRSVSLWRDLLAQGRDPLHAQRVPAWAEAGAEGSLERARVEWIDACRGFDESTAQQALDEAFAKLPAETVVAQVILTGLADLGEEWYMGNASVQQEHFASEVAVRRVQRLIGATPPPVRSGRLLVFCPALELHSLSLLFLNFLLRRQGWDVLYLGPDVPLSNLEQTLQLAKSDLVVMAAQRPYTAATLLESARDLRAREVAVAYGGRVFNLVPSARRRVPGHFLGETLAEAPAKVEALMLAGPGVVDAEPVPEEFGAALAAYAEARPEVETATAQGLGGRGVAAPYLKVANDGLASAITAALAYGDEALLRHEIGWLEGMLAHRGMLDETLTAYLDAYVAALEQVLGARSTRLAGWLSGLRNDLS